MKQLTAKQLDKKAYIIAGKSTYDNPINVMKLGALKNVVQAAIVAGATDEEAEAKGVEFIKSLQGA